MNVLALDVLQISALVPYLCLAFALTVSLILVGFKCPAFLLKYVHVLTLTFCGYLFFSSLGTVGLSVFGTSLFVDDLTRIVGAGVCLLAAVSGLLFGNDEKQNLEWSPLIIISTIGLAAIPGSRDVPSFFIALETVSVAGYAIAALRARHMTSLEAGLKYLFMGAFASAFFLLGFVLIYGQSQSFKFEDIQMLMQQGQSLHTLTKVGSFFVVAALAFKLAIVPFHMWAPDVYQAAPVGGAAFLATANKLAIFPAAMILTYVSGLVFVPGLLEFILICGVLSIVVANLVASVNTSVRRVLGYSSIVNAGYLALAWASGVHSIQGMLAFLALYALGFVLAMASLKAMISEREDVSIAELKQIKGHSFSKFVFALSIFSLAGIPPLPGFFGKYFLLVGIWSAGHIASAAFMIIGSFLALAYYLKILSQLFFHQTQDQVSLVHE
jgi:NADH-quinone oxidoreductase subunit N